MYGDTKQVTRLEKTKKCNEEYELSTDYFAKSMTKFFRFFADTFFAKRYGHRAVVLETVAGVPGMVAGMLVHLKSLRTHKRGYGPIIRKLLAEAENERMHLMFFIEIAQPNKAGAGSHNLGTVYILALLLNNVSNLSSYCSHDDALLRRGSSQKLYRISRID